MKPILHQKIVIPALLSFVVSGSCGTEAPQLPSEDTLMSPTFEVGSANALTSTTNVSVAALSVGLVTLGVELALFTPRLIFAGVVTQEPEYAGDQWVWKNDFPLLGIRGELFGEQNGGTLDLEMHVTGLRADTEHLDDFLWFRGTHQLKSGQWEVFDPGTDDAPGPTHPVLQIDWAINADDDRELTFLNVNQGAPQEDDQLGYTLLGSIASMSIFDAASGELDDGPPSSFSVTWHIEDGSGIMETDTETFCWDTLEQGQIDMTCPTGPWPAP